MGQVLLRRRLLYAFFAVAALVLLSHWFFHPDVIFKSDTLFHLNRILGIASGLAAGDFPVYVHGFQMRGYGTLDGALYPDLLLYLPATLVYLGVPLSLAWNVHWVFLVCLSFLAMWRGYTLLGGRVYLGLVAALLYASPFFLMTYLGSGVGGYVAISFLPYVVGLLYAILRRPDGARHWPELVLAFVVIAGDHVITTLLSVMIALACLLLWRKGLSEAPRRRGLLLAAGFSLALLLYRAVPFVYFSRRVDFWLSHAYIPSLASMTCDAQNLLIVQFWWGWPLAALFFAACCSRALRRRRGFRLMAVLVLLLTAMTWSGFPWQAIGRIPLLGAELPLFQFPYRFMTLGLVPLVYFLARYLVAAVRRLSARLPQRFPAGRRSSRMCVLLLALLFVGNGIYTINHVRFQLGILPITWDVVKYMDLTAQTMSGDRSLFVDYTYADVDLGPFLAKSEAPQLEEVRPLAGSLDVRSFEKTGTRVSFSYDSPAGAEVMVPLFFYPGYEAQVDGRRLTPRAEAHHVLALSLPAGEHQVTVRYRGPLSFRVSAWVSLLALVLFCFAVWRQRRRRRDSLA